MVSSRSRVAWEPAQDAADQEGGAPPCYQAAWSVTAGDQRIVAAQSTDSVKADVMDALLPPFNRPHYPVTPRILRTRFLDEWADRPDELAVRAGEIAPRMLDSVPRGDGHGYLPFTGQSVGLVHEVLPAAELIRRTLAEAEAAIAGLGQRDRALRMD